MPAAFPESIEFATHRKNLRILAGLRAVAFVAQVTAILVTYNLLNIVLPVASMVATAALLVAFNIWCLYRLRSPRPVPLAELFIGLIVDVGVLTAQLYFSGGTANPFVSFYMLPVIIGAVMLSAAYAWAIYGLTLACYLGLAVAVLNQPMPDMPGMNMPLVSRFNLHMHGMMLGYAVSAGVLVFVITRIRENLAARDRELDAVKTQALQEEHIVRLGLLAAGAAHELGTPLTTLSVILNDMRHLPLPKRKGEFIADVATMQAQVERCKGIVSGILASTGQMRGEGGERQPIGTFLLAICEAWKVANPNADFKHRIVSINAPILADKVIAQAVVNLLDNAWEASNICSSRAVRLDAATQGDAILITVEDEGPGFDKAVTGHIGAPYVTTKDETNRGRGLGLFLVANTMRMLGGTLETENLKQGARVRLRFPLEAIRVADA